MKKNSQGHFPDCICTENSQVVPVVLDPPENVFLELQVYAVPRAKMWVLLLENMKMFMRCESPYTWTVHAQLLWLKMA